MNDTMTRPPTPPAPPDRPTPSAPPPSRRARIAWLIPGGLLAVGALVSGTFNVLGLLAHDAHTTRSTFAADEVTALDVGNDNGSVIVTAGDVDEIVVVAEIDDGWRATDVTQRVVDGVLELRGDCSWLGDPWCGVDFTVTIPADVPITVNGSNGSVTVRDVAARVDIHTDNGSVLLEDVSGAIRGSSNNGRVVGRRLTAAMVDASTDNGRIELSFTDPPTSVSARTNNGSVDIVVPDRDVLYRVAMRSGEGSTENSVRTDPSSERSIDASTDNGSITVRPPG